MTNNVPKPKKHVCFLLGCVVLLLTAAAHTAAHLSGPPKDMTPEQVNLFHLMQTVEIKAFGRAHTMEGFNSGFSWFFAASLALLAGLGAAVWWTRRADRGLIRLVAAFYVVFLASMTGVSAVDFPLPAPRKIVAGAVLLLIGFATA